MRNFETATVSKVKKRISPTVVSQLFEFLSKNLHKDGITFHKTKRGTSNLVDINIKYLLTRCFLCPYYHKDEGVYYISSLSKKYNDKLGIKVYKGMIDYDSLIDSGLENGGGINRDKIFKILTHYNKKGNIQYKFDKYIALFLYEMYKKG